MKYKVGDKVIPRLNKIKVKDCIDEWFHGEMKDYFEKEHTIIEIEFKGYLTEEGNNFLFLEHWLEPVNTNNQTDIEKPIDDFFDRAYTSLCKMQKEKNKRYGNAALEPLDIFTGKTKVDHKIHDKLSRVKHSKVLNKNDISDLIGYLMLVCKENNWDNFEDLID